MATQTVKLKVSPAVAAYVAPSATTDQKLQGISLSVSFGDADRLLLLYCLMKDREAAVAGAARQAFIALETAAIVTLADRPECHPAILDAIARYHHAKQAVAAVLLANPALSSPARDFLEATGYGPSLSPEICAAAPEEVEEPVELLDEADLLDEEQEEGEADEETDQFRSKYQLSQSMGVGEKIKMALTGDK